MKERFRVKRPQFRLFDATGLTPDVHKSLTLAIVAVTFCMVYMNITSGATWTGFLRLLGADAYTLGVISAIPVAASTLQIIASYILEKGRKRRALFLAFGLVNRLSWVVIGLVPFIFPIGAEGTRLVAVMLLLLVSSSGGAFLNVSFYSLIGDLVPMRIRGRYFSSRQAVSLLAGIVTGLFVSWLMDRATGFTGYTIVLVIAGVFGALDICCFFWVKWPPMEQPKDKGESLPAMLRAVLKDPGYMKIVGYFTLWFFSVNIAAPFYNVYLLEHVKMTFTEITLVNQIIPNVATVLIISWWGRQMDRFGNQPVVQTAGLYCMILPLAYILTGPRSFLILPFVNVFSGMAWPASDLGQQNMYLAKAPALNRSMYVAVFFTSTQLLGTALSNYVGGLLMSGPFKALEGLNLRLLNTNVTRFDFMFLLTGVLRMGCVLLLLPHLRQGADTRAPEMWKELLGQTGRRTKRLFHDIRAKRIRARYHKKLKAAKED